MGNLDDKYRFGCLAAVTVICHKEIGSESELAAWSSTVSGKMTAPWN